MEKAFEIQKQIRDNAKTLNSYMTDLQNWEAEMKRKEAALSGEFEQAIPPVRSKAKKEKPLVVKKKPDPRISASDYLSWEKFDVDKACEDIDMQDVGPVSLDSKKSQSAKMDKLREEAQHEKERGNNYVKQEKWDEAIKCYNRAIELVKDDAIYFANRGLCYLKKDSLHQAETDCSEALRLDPTYVKALQRRATARERLGSLRAASNDLTEVIKLEPKNKAAQTQLNQIKTRMGTKGAKSKSSPSSTPTTESKSIAKATPKAQPKIIELETPSAAQQSAVDNWKNGVGENVTVLKPVKKPPHLRSKRPLKSVPIQEIPLGKTSPEKPVTRLKIEEIDSDSNKENNENKLNSEDKLIIENKLISENKLNSENKMNKGDGDAVIEKASPESVKLVAEEIVTEKESRVPNLVPPVNSVQFMAEWKYLSGNDAARSDYLSIIEPSKISSIFANALESSILSDILVALHGHTHKYKQHGVLSYLAALARVKRFSALAMFLSTQDKHLLTELLDYCKNNENCSDTEIADLRNKYEL